MMAYGREGSARLAALEDAEGEAARLQAEHDRAAAELAEAEAAVRTVRARAAGAFGEAGRRAPGDAGHGGGPPRGAGGARRARGSRSSWRWGPTSGEPVQPLARAASGGELARAMLAIRLVGLGGPQTMVFDEVDAGVGGAAALSLGEALHEVAGDRQVLVVTHLAQVASRADAQISVVKQAARGRTVTSATPVRGEDRVTELSRMLSGHPGSDAARAHARELLGATDPGDESATSSVTFDYRGRVHRSRQPIARRAEGGVSKFIFVTGGVSSSLGKGLTASSLGRLLKCRGCG